jgi:hypothetical protein
MDELGNASGEQPHANDHGESLYENDRSGQPGGYPKKVVISTAPADQLQPP